MADYLEIQFARPLASVDTIRPEQAGQGQEQARRQMQEQIETELSEFRVARGALYKARDQFQDLHAQFCHDAEQQLLGLSLEIARKVLMQEIKAGRHEIDPIVREALSRLPERVDAEVHLNPQDLARCEMARQDGQASEESSISFVGDVGVCRGECLVRTVYGTVESSIDGHMNEIAQALVEPE